MKILHILYSGLGGHGNVFFSMVEADSKNEFEFEALFMGDENIRNEYVERCKTNSVPYTFIQKIPEKKHFSFYYQIYKNVLKSKADIIFIHGSMTLVPAWLAKTISFSKKKIIVRETQAIHLKASREKNALRMSMRLADKIVFLSHAYLEEIKKDFGENFKENKVVLIPNGINLIQFSPSPKQGNLDQLVIGMQSRVVAIKDHETLLQSFALLKRSEPSKRFLLKIAGDGDRLNFLKKLAEELNLKEDVLFLGMLDENELPHFLNSLDIYVHASYGETMSTAIMQAMACGKAIVASDVDGISNMLINNSTGLLVPLKNESLMAEAIFSIINNDGLKRSLETEAYNFALSNFSNFQMLSKYTQIFKIDNII